MTIVVGVKTKVQIVSRETACPNSRSTRSKFGYLVNYVFLSIILHEFSLEFPYMMTILYDKCAIMKFIEVIFNDRRCISSVCGVFFCSLSYRKCLFV